MKKIVMILFAAAFIFGCSDKGAEDGDNTAQGEISLSAVTVDFQTSGSATGEGSIKVTSSSKWRLAGKKGWCTPSAMEGTSGQSVTFTVEPNTLPEPRSATFSFICGNKTKTVVVTQKQNAVLEILGSQGEYEVNPVKGDLTIRTKGNADLKYSVKDGVDWIIPVDTRSVETAFIKFHITENTTNDARIGHITFAVDGKEVVVSVNQLQNNVVNIKQKIYTVAAGGGKIEIPLDRNIDPVILPSDTWIKRSVAPANTRGLISDQIVFDISEADVSRAGKIDFSDPKGNLLATVFVRQSSANPVYQIIPDENFRAFLANEMYIMPGEGEKCEITGKGLSLTSINCVSSNIKSLEGIEAFTELTSLQCGYNFIKKLDLSKNTKLVNDYTVRLTSNPLEELILPESFTTLNFYNSLYSGSYGEEVYSSKIKIVGKNITSVSCEVNELESIDVSGCPSIKTLVCNSNVGLTSINMKGCTLLDKLTAYTTALTTLDLSEQTALKTLTCYDSKLMSLTLPNSSILNDVQCHKNKLTTLDVSKNTNITKLLCDNNKLTTLDVSNNEKLSTLKCTDNPDLATLYMKQGQVITNLEKSETTTIELK